MFFGSNLDILIKRHKMTGKRLSEELELTGASVSGYINGVAFPKVETLLRIAKYFNTDLNTLFFKDLSQFDFDEKNQIEFNEDAAPYGKPPNTEGVLETMQKQIKDLNEQMERLEKRLDKIQKTEK